MKKTSAAITAIVYISLLAVAVGVIVLVLAFVNNGQKNFYVQYGNEKISYKAENVELPKNATTLFYCKNVLGVTDEQAKANNFTVRIEPNQKLIADFDFTVDGKTKGFYGNLDLTQGLTIVKGEGYFSVYLPEELTLHQLLQACYPDSMVSGVPDINLYEKDYLSIVVYSEEENATVTIWFH
jgi:hypothetical protein